MEITITVDAGHYGTVSLSKSVPHMISTHADLENTKNHDKAEEHLRDLTDQAQVWIDKNIR